MKERESNAHQPARLHPTATGELPTDVDKWDGVVLSRAADALFGSVQVMDPHDDHDHDHGHDHDHHGHAH
jgi:hypothetical protein